MTSVLHVTAIKLHHLSKINFLSCRKWSIKYRFVIIMVHNYMIHFNVMNVQLKQNKSIYDLSQCFAT